ncbi:MAG: TRAP transporter large permease subunit [Sulfolobales archaeon]
MAPTNRLSRSLGYARAAIVLIYSALVLYYFATGWQGARKFVVLMVPLSVVLWTLDSLSKGESLVPRLKNFYANLVVGAVFVSISLASWYYIDQNFWDLVSVRMGFYTLTDLIMGGLLAFVVLWFGAVKYPIIFAIVAFFMLHALYGRYFPGVMWHPGISLTRMIAAFSVDFSTGIFESLSQLAATVISAFMLLVGILNGLGLVKSINDIVLTRLRSPQLIPLTNILVGVPVGMVTGSAGAATATVGSLTVPLVKDLGVPLAMAAAMAAVAGVGAQLMPPIMGASAFIMADALGVPYFEVMIRGFVPAIVYFAGSGVAIFYISTKTVKRVSSLTRRAAGPSPKEQLSLDYVHTAIFAIGITVLILLMAFWVYAPLAALRSAILVATLTLIAQVVFLRRTGFTVAQIARDLGKKAWRSLEFFVVETSNLVLLLAFLGMLKALFTVTGFSLKLGTTIVSASLGSLYVAALLSYLFGYLVGAGVPPVGTYVIVYPVIVPALVRLGVPMWASQFTAFFAAVHAEFAPPMSVAAATISRVARVSYTSVLRELVKMGIALPIIILVTPIKPELVLEPGLKQVITGAIVALGVLGLESVAYWRLHSSRPIDVLLKVALVVGSIMAIFARGLFEILGVLIALPLTAYSIFTAMKAYRQVDLSTGSSDTANSLILHHPT